MPLPPRPVDAAPRLSAAQLTDEQAIVWLVDAATLAALPYVREAFYCFRNTTGRPKWGGRVLGWANLRPVKRGERRGLHSTGRRLFWLADSDPTCPGPVYGRAPGHAPCEAVDPTTIECGQGGLFTARSAAMLQADIPREISAGASTDASA